MKYTDEKLIELCNEKDLTFVKTEYRFVNNKKRRCCIYICNKHQQYGEQCKAVEKIENIKQPCVYCNHSMLKVTIKDEIDPNIELLGEYIDSETSISCRCKIHNQRWNGLPSVLLNGGTGCAKCIAKKKWDTRGRITTDIFKSEIEQMYPNIRVIGEYLGTHKYIECFCLIHQISWSSIACNIKNGTAICPECSAENKSEVFRLSDDEVKNKLKEVLPHIKMVGKYKTLHTPTKFYCSIHNENFINKPRTMLYGKSKGCCKCSASLGETKLLHILEDIQKHNINTQYIFDDCKNINKLRFDAFDVENGVAYEYQGQQHYYPVNFGNMTDEQANEEYQKNVLRDKIKKEYCKKNNIPLITIPYWEYDNMEEYIVKEQSKI